MNGHNYAKILGFLFLLKLRKHVTDKLLSLLQRDLIIIYFNWLASTKLQKN